MWKVKFDKHSSDIILGMQAIERQRTKNEKEMTTPLT